MDIVFTKDTLVGGIHFFEDDNAAIIGQKAQRVNLSDLAAMGAEPVGYLLSIAYPKDGLDIEEWLAGFSNGLMAAQKEFGWHLWGGDTVSTTGPITISITAIGIIAKGKGHKRCGANIGDDIYVSGTLGDSAGGLAVLNDNLDRHKYSYLIDRYHRPTPRLKLGKALIDIATSLMDISDGLMGDLNHICHNSKVGARVYLKNIPISEPFGNLLAIKDEYSRLIWGGGDDYELLFTAHANNEAAVKDLSEKFDIPLTKIGKITADMKLNLLDVDGAEIDIKNSGFHHF